MSSSNSTFTPAVMINALVGAVIAFVIGILCMHFLPKLEWGKAALWGLVFAIGAFSISIAIQLMIRGNRSQV